MSKTGRVLRIEKTSIHDGEGLRTVVFLKGCPLRCKWCSTPESQRMEIEKGYGKDMTVEEVVKEICKDEIFFFHSGGGVTISGGEVLMQADFAKEILISCMEQGIPTAIETSLYSSYDKIRELLPYLTSMYIDFKVADERLHEFYTGMSNKRIKENLVKVDAEFAGDIHIRIPVIPTVNMNENNMKDTIKFLSNLKHIKDIELLPYHRLGLETYERLERVYELKDVEIPDMEMLKKMAEVIRAEDPKAAVKVKGE